MSPACTRCAQQDHLRPPARRRPSGFTLLEVLLVVVLVGLTYTLLPRLLGTGISGADLKANVRTVASGLRLARDTAVNTRRDATLTVNVNDRSFSVTGDERVHRLHEKLEIKLFSAQDDVIDASTAVFRFFPDGSSNGGRITLVANGREFAVDIDWLTGRISVLDSADGDATSNRGRS